MKVQIEAIQPSYIPRIFDVIVLIGTKQYQFPIKVELDTIANQEIQIINGDENFSDTFRFNQGIATEICKVVAKFYNHKLVELPLKIGEFNSSELSPVKR